MKLSVVTVCRNSASTIGRTLESFFAQHHPDKELVVIDGASTDGTLNIVRSFGPERLTLISEPDQGIYDAMNKGLRAFRGEAVGFLNSDDCFSDAEALGAIADGLAECDIVFGNLDIVTSHEHRRVIRRWRARPYVRGAFKRGWMPPHPTFYCHRQVVESVGPFDLRYHVAADYDFMLRCLELTSFTARSIDRILVDQLHGGRSTSGLGASIHHNLEALDSRRRRLGAGRFDFALIGKPIRKISQLFPGVRHDP